MTIKGRLLSTCPMLKAFSSEVPSKKGPKMAVLGAKRGEKFNFWFCDPQRARPCAEPRLLTYLRQNPCGRLGCRRDEEPQKNETIAE